MIDASKEVQQVDNIYYRKISYLWSLISLKQLCCRCKESLTPPMPRFSDLARFISFGKNGSFWPDKAKRKNKN